MDVAAAGRVLSELVARPSISLDAGQEPPDARHGEAQVAEYVRAYLADLNVAVSTQPVFPGRDNVLGTLRGPEPGPTLLLTAHMDTIPPVGWPSDPFAPVVNGDRLTGCGSCDCKGSLAAMLLAFAELAREREALAGTVVLGALVGEEKYGQGARWLVESGFRADGAIVGEPTDLDLVVAQSGNVRWRIRAVGRAAHSSRPWEGENAIYRMAEVVSVIRDEVAPACRQITHPLIGPAACSVGLIEGGTIINIVPAACSIAVERRVLPGEDPLAVMEAINAVVRKRCPDDADGRLEFDAPFSLSLPVATAPDAPLARAMVAAGAETGHPVRPIGVSFGSDASRLVVGEIPCVVFGPGSITQAHRVHETIDLREVAAAARMLVAATRTFLRASES